MAPLSVAGILKELDDVVGDQLQVRPGLPVDRPPVASPAAQPLTAAAPTLKKIRALVRRAP